MELHEKVRVLSQLPQGTLVKLTNGELFNFVKLNRTRFKATKYQSHESGVYTVPIEMFESIEYDNHSTDTRTFNNGELIYSVDFNSIWRIYKYVKKDEQTGRHICSLPDSTSHILLSSEQINGCIAELIET